ncbi:hypothetical protein [Bradyrhizobium sp. STM 3557]|uniref:hypothetical protein n=1 Tax=Bradyrhizobium sp. STM 3557 TaxID=578920 RepID=UPI003890234C
MASRPPVHHPSSSDFDQTTQMRRIVQRARELLKQSLPDTFLGRKTFEPFPQQGEPAREQDQ